MARRYGVVALVALVLIAGAAGIWQWHVSRVRAQVATIAASYLQALQAADAIQPGLDDPGLDGRGHGDRAQASARGKVLAMLAPIQTSDADGIRTLARLRAAGIEGDGGNNAGAIATLGTVTSDEHADESLRAVATLFSVQRRIDAADLAGQGAARLQGELAAIEAPGAPFRALALETSGLIDLAIGDATKARQMFQMIVADGTAPRTVRERAETLLVATSPGDGA